MDESPGGEKKRSKRREDSSEYNLALGMSTWGGQRREEGLPEGGAVHRASGANALPFSQMST